MKKIKIACETQDTLDWHLIQPLQGNYKKHTEKQLEKLCNLIIKRGVRFPSFVSKIKNDIWAIDTHRRLKAYEQLEKDGWTIPPIPIVYIDAKDKNEAKQLLLEVDSKYGTANQSGFDEFVSDLDFIDEDEMSEFYSNLELSGIDIEGMEISDPPDNLDQENDKDKILYVKVNCESAEQVRYIVSILEKSDIDKKAITISA